MSAYPCPREGITDALIVSAAVVALVGHCVLELQKVYFFQVARLATGEGGRLQSQFLLRERTSS